MFLLNQFYRQIKLFQNESDTNFYAVIVFRFHSRGARYDLSISGNGTGTGFGTRPTIVYGQLHAMPRQEWE